MKNVLLWVPRKVKWVLVAVFSDVRKRKAAEADDGPSSGL